MARVLIETYGCTLNQADSDIMHALLSASHTIVSSADGADVIVLNTCTVKGATENKIFERLRRLAAAGRPLVVAGCLSANVPKIAKCCPRAPIVAPSALEHICAAVSDALEGRAGQYLSPASKEGLPKLLTAPVCRIPINDGCVSKCHFCHTRFARPNLRSYTPKTIVKWMNAAVESGAREIQLTSQDSGAYGLDIRTGLLQLLGAIEADDSYGRAEDEYLVRLGMINPEHAKRLLPGIIRSLSGRKFYRFLHVPVQTGSEKVCREMNRDHSVKDFMDIVTALRGSVPDTAVATDIIVGYPTETEEDFAQTLALLREVRPETVNLSKFSPRPGTVAKGLRQLPNGEIKRRSEEASAAIKGITLAARKAYVGRRLRVLVTEKDKDFKGRAINYMQVVVKGYRGPLGGFADVDIFDANHGSLFGEIAKG